MQGYPYQDKDLLAFEEFHGRKIPRHKLVKVCRKRACCNPKHMAEIGKPTPLNTVLATADLTKDGHVRPLGWDTSVATKEWIHKIRKKIAGHDNPLMKCKDAACIHPEHIL